MECAKWFEGENSLVQHRRGKNHKRRLHPPPLFRLSECSTFISFLTRHRVRSLRDEPYTQKEAEAAVGLRTDNGTRETIADAASAQQLAPMEVEDAMNQ